jgi:hypothetical protein
VDSCGHCGDHLLPGTGLHLGIAEGILPRTVRLRRGRRGDQGYTDPQPPPRDFLCRGPLGHRLRAHRPGPPAERRPPWSPSHSPGPGQRGLLAHGRAICHQMDRQDRWPVPSPAATLAIACWKSVYGLAGQAAPSLLPPRQLRPRPPGFNPGSSLALGTSWAFLGRRE